MGSGNSRFEHSKLDLATTCTSSILEKTPDTICLKVQNEYNDQVPKSVVDILKSDEYRNLRPDLFDRVLFHDRYCKIIVEIDSHEPRQGNDLCINVSCLDSL